MERNTVNKYAPRALEIAKDFRDMGKLMLALGKAERPGQFRPGLEHMTDYMVTVRL